MTTASDDARSDQPALIGAWTATALVIGNTIGIGIFLMPAALAPFGLNALIGWLVTAIGCTFLAGVYARLARDYPNPDGPYGYIRATQGGTIAFVSAWCYWVSLWITNATLAIGVVGYLQAFAPQLANLAPAPLIALALLWLFVAINLFGVQSSGPVQVATTVLKLAPMAVVILLGVWILFTEPRAYIAHVPTTPITVPQIMAASTTALFALLGLESASIPASRVRDPARIIPRATLVGTILTATIYISVSIIPMLLVPQAELAQSQAPFADLIARTSGGDFARWIALFVVVSGLGCLNGWTLLVGEFTRTMAANGVLPKLLARDNKRGAPALALFVTALLATIMINMNYSKSLVEGFAFMSVIVSAANLPLYFFSAIALLLFAARAKKASLPLLMLGLVGAGYVVFAFIGMGREPFLWALVLAGAGLPFYLLTLWKQRKTAPAHKGNPDAAPT
jgi:APA family basic amino acid/polyamine antiporter